MVVLSAVFQIRGWLRVHRSNSAPMWYPRAFSESRAMISNGLRRVRWSEVLLASRVSGGTLRCSMGRCTMRFPSKGGWSGEYQKTFGRCTGGQYWGHSSGCSRSFLAKAYGGSSVVLERANSDGKCLGSSSWQGWDLVATLPCAGGWSSRASSYSSAVARFH